MVYQIYPLSYQDTNSDGKGDLRGIIARLDYVQSLHVNAVWLSPIYPSPMHDFGYDVADYCDIHPHFGTMEDFDALLGEVHKRDMKLILDFVPNHTSTQHPWFLESRSSRNNPKRDWYIWRDGKKTAEGEKPPNNWTSCFGGSAWTKDALTEQYYYHQFHEQQPDLDYSNPAVVESMLQNIRFWLNKGVDGFRVDALQHMTKAASLPDEPVNPDWNGLDSHHALIHVYSQNLPENHQLVRKIRAVFDEYSDRLLIGELYLPVEELMKYYGEPPHQECHIPFNFRLVTSKWECATIKKEVNHYESSLPHHAWPNWVLGNHDNRRVSSRIGRHQVRNSILLLLTLRGTPTVYYGEELGMENVDIPSHLVRDPPAVLQPHIAHIVGRDPVRTPMKWDSSANCGFTAEKIEPWLPLCSNPEIPNVAEQSQRPESVLSLFRALAGLRAAEPALSIGAYTHVELEDELEQDIYCYTRAHQHEEGGVVSRFASLLNFSACERILSAGGQ